MNIRAKFRIGDFILTNVNLIIIHCYYTLTLSLVREGWGSYFGSGRVDIWRNRWTGGIFLAGSVFFSRNNAIYGVLEYI